MRPILLTAILGAAVAASAMGENLLKEGSFEEPVVTGRTPAQAGGSPLRAEGQTTWASFAADPATDGGRVAVGLTNEIARTGRQAMYVDFEKVTAMGRPAVLATGLVAVKSGQAYRVSIWGRVDRKRPLALDERRPYMWVEVRFFKADQTTAAGEPIRGPQLIPGTVDPGGAHELMFVSGKWRESFARVTTPESAAFVKVIWSWTTPRDEGETDGVIYWDDAAIEEERPSDPITNVGPKKDEAIRLLPQTAKPTEAPK